MTTPVLRPLGIGETLDVAIKIYWRNALKLFGLVVFIVLPAQIVVNLIEASLVNARTGNSSDTATLIGGGVAALAVGGIASLFATAACFKAIADAYLGERSAIGSSLGFALRRLPALILMTILLYLFVLLGFVALVIPGLYLWISFTVAVPVLLMEHASAVRALGRSRELVRGRWWSTFGLVLIAGIATGIVGGIFSALVAAFSISAGGVNTLGGFLVATASGTLSKTLTTPFTAAVVTVLYVDLRVRKEGFDLQLLADRLGLAERSATELLLPPPPAARPPATGPQPPYWPPPPGWKPEPDPVAETEST